MISLNSDALVPQISIDHAVLEADKNNEPVFYNTLAFDHPGYDISSSAPDKEYLNKVHRLATGGHKNINGSKELIDIYEMRQRNNWEGADSVYELGFYQIMCQENGFLTRRLYVCFQNGKHKGCLYTSKRIWNSVPNQHEEKRRSLTSMTL